MVAKRRQRKTQVNVEEHVRQYEVKRPLYIDFTQKLTGLLEILLNSSGIKFQVVEHRTKEVESFREKITRANKTYSDPLVEITDLVGLRIIVYYLEDVRLVSSLIEKEFSFDKDASVDKGKLLQPNEFGYRSVHYIVSLSESRKGLLEWQHFSRLNAEIQIRTVLQHAWAAISHTLQYKAEADVPSQFRRKLSRLSGLLELSDEEFSTLKKEQQNFASAVSVKIEQGNISLELNAITLQEYLESEFVVFLAEAAKQVGFTITEETPDKLRETSSRIIAACTYVGIRTVKELDENLQKTRNWAKEYFEFQYRESKYGSWRATPSFLIELLLLRLFSEPLNSDFLIEQGWNKSVARRVAKLAREKL